jgi:hypothetical protein
MLILGCVVGAVGYLYWPDLAGIDPNGFAAQPDGAKISPDNLQHLMRLATGFARFAGLIVLVSLIVRSMISVGVLRKALGLHEGPVFVYFSLGAPVWRMIAAMFLAVIIIVVVVLLSFAAVGIIAFAAGKFVPQAAGPIKAIAIIAAVLWCIYMSIRLVFFLPAVVVAEERIGLGRSWELGGGNFWRSVALLIAVTLPAAIVAGIVSRVLFGDLFLNLVLQAAHPNPAVTPHALLATMFQQVRDRLPIFLVFELAYVTLLTGLGLGAIAAAYQGVTETKGEA